MPSNVLLDAFPSESSLPPPFLTSTFSPFDLLKVPFAHHARRFSKRSIRDMMEVKEESDLTTFDVATYYILFLTEYTLIL